MVKTKAIIVDLWGTILENGVYPSPIVQTKKFLGLFKMDYSEFVVRFETAFMTNNHKDIKEALTQVFKEFDVDPKEYNREEKIIGLWNKSKILAKMYSDTNDTLISLKKDYKLFLLTNLLSTQKDLIDRFKLNEYFDKIYLSCDIGCLKSEGGFEKILKDNKLKPGEVIMVGDSMESDIEGANKVGIKGILLDRRKKRDYEHKITSFNDLMKVINNG